MTAEQLREKYADAFSRTMADGAPDFTDDDSAAHYPKSLFSHDYAPSLIVYSRFCQLETATMTFTYRGARSGDFYYSVSGDDSAEIVGTAYEALAEKGTRTLTVPAEIDGHPVTAVGPAAFAYLGKAVPTLTAIQLPDSITKISHSAFLQAFDLRSGCWVNLPANVQYLGHLCFGSLQDALGESLTLPETLEYIDYCAFGQSAFIPELTLPESNVVCLTGNLIVGENAHIWLPSAVMHPAVEAFLNGEPTGAEAEEALPEAAPETPEAEPAGAAARSGDTDRNGAVNIADAVLLARFLRGGYGYPHLGRGKAGGRPQC